MKFELEPLSKDVHGRAIEECHELDFYETISTALLQAHTDAVWIDFLADRGADDRRLKDEAQDEIFSLLEVMTACATRINALATGYHFKAAELAEFQKDFIAYNRERGKS